MEDAECSLTLCVCTPSISISGGASSTSGGLGAGVVLGESLGTSSTSAWEGGCVGESVVVVVVGVGGGVAASLLVVVVVVVVLASSFPSICGIIEQVNNRLGTS